MQHMLSVASPSTMETAAPHRCDRYSGSGTPCAVCVGWPPLDAGSVHSSTKQACTGSRTHGKATATTPCPNGRIRTFGGVGAEPSAAKMERTNATRRCPSHARAATLTAASSAAPTATHTRSGPSDTLPGAAMPAWQPGAREWFAWGRHVGVALAELVARFWCRRTLTDAQQASDDAATFRCSEFNPCQMALSMHSSVRHLKRPLLLRIPPRQPRRWPRSGAKTPPAPPPRWLAGRPSF